MYTSQIQHVSPKLRDYPCNLSLVLDQLMQLKPNFTIPQDLYLHPLTLHNSKLPLKQVD